MSVARDTITVARGMSNEAWLWASAASFGKSSKLNKQIINHELWASTREIKG